MTRESWVEKHRPDDFDEVQGNTSALEDIEDWIDGWSPGDPPILLVGPPGTGKTSTAYIVSNHADLQLNEVNASSARKTDDVERVAGQMRAGEQLVLLDETDSWHHAVNLDPLNRELQSPQNPMVMTANEEYDVPQAVKGPADVYEFSLSTSSRRAKIKDIAKREGVPLDEKDLERLVDRPDLRSAINDLQLHAEMGVPVSEDQRDWDTSEFAAMDDMIQHEDASDVDVRPPWLVMWLDQNIRKQYVGLEAAAAYDALSRADVYLGGAQPGDYRGWRYAGILAELTADIRLSDPYTGWVSWDFPAWVQSTVPSATDDSPEAVLYRELKDLGTYIDDNGKKRLKDDRPGYSLSGGYIHFRESVLPILRRLPAAEREALVVGEGLGEEAASALGVSSAEYGDLTVDTEARAGEELDPATGDALEGDW